MIEQHENQTIDPRLPESLAAGLDALEVLHTEGAILWEIERRGWLVRLRGPDPTLGVDRRWDVAIMTIGADDLLEVSTTGEGQTALIALARAFIGDER